LRFLVAEVLLVLLDVAPEAASFDNLLENKVANKRFIYGAQMNSFDRNAGPY